MYFCNSQAMKLTCSLAVMCKLTWLELYRKLLEKKFHKSYDHAGFSNTMPSSFRIAGCKSSELIILYYIFGCFDCFNTYSYWHKLGFLPIFFADLWNCNGKIFSYFLGKFLYSYIFPIFSIKEPYFFLYFSVFWKYRDGMPESDISLIKKWKNL